MSKHLFAILLSISMLSTIIVTVTLINERLDHQRHPCGCDTCVETYWEAIRIAHPELNMKPIDDY